MPAAAPRTGVSATGMMPPAPVVAEAPECWRCVWVAIGPGRYRLKLTHGSCEHAETAVRWDFERWQAGTLFLGAGV